MKGIKKFKSPENMIEGSKQREDQENGILGIYPQKKGE